MSDVLTNLGASPQMQGLANFGGIIALAIYGFALARWVWQKRSWLKASWRSFQRASTLRKITILRLTGRMHRRGASDFLVVWPKLWKIFANFAEMILSSVICLINVIFYVKFSSDVNAISALLAFFYIAIKAAEIANLGEIIMAQLVFRIDRGTALIRLRAEIFRTRRMRK